MTSTSEKCKIMLQRLIKIIKFITNNFINHSLEEIYQRKGKANSASARSQKNKNGCVTTQLLRIWSMLAKKNVHYYSTNINFSKKIIIHIFKTCNLISLAWWKIQLMGDICQELQQYFKMREVHQRKELRLRSWFLWRDLLLLMLLLTREKRALEI